MIILDPVWRKDGRGQENGGDGMAWEGAAGLWTMIEGLHDDWLVPFLSQIKEADKHEQTEEGMLTWWTGHLSRQQNGKIRVKPEQKEASFVLNDKKEKKTDIILWKGLTGF